MSIPVSPPYWAKACRDLSHADPVMGRLIRHHSPSVLKSRGDAFTTLARAIVGQQISVKAAASIWDRVCRAVEPFNADTVYRCDLSHFAGLGLSARKVDYLKDLSRHFVQTPNLEAVLGTLTDDAVVARLTQIKGIGSWSAEMFLLFGLMRPDILPVKDLGLLKAISLHYHAGEPISAHLALQTAAPWRPWRSVATWFLWASLDPIPVDY
jgi:DNA-3-methyladenine glycosylase II